MTKNNSPTKVNFWLMKTEPNTYSFANMQAEPEQTTMWEGVRNYQARNFMRDDMKVGDIVFIYHSKCKPPGIVGLARVVSKPYPDPTQFDPNNKYYDEKSTQDVPRWILVNVQAIRELAKYLPLTMLKAEPRLQNMKLVQRGNRLSIMPVTIEDAEVIFEIANDNLDNL